MTVGGNKIGVEVALENHGFYTLGSERMKLGGRGMKIGKLVDKSVSGIREPSDESCRFDIDGPNGGALTRRLPPDHIRQNFQIPAWRNRKRFHSKPYHGAELGNLDNVHTSTWYPALKSDWNKPTVPIRIWDCPGIYCSLNMLGFHHRFRCSAHHSL
jgi:hypothetical protein